jgi:hypothetical protein
VGFQPRRSERYLLGFHPPSDDNAKVLRPVEFFVVVPNLTTKDYQIIYEYRLIHWILLQQKYDSSRKTLITSILEMM